MAKIKRTKGQNNGRQISTQKTKYRVTRELICYGLVSSSSSACVIRLVTNPIKIHEWEKDWVIITTNGTYLWSFVIKFAILIPYFDFLYL